MINEPEKQHTSFEVFKFMHSDLTTSDEVRKRFKNVEFILNRETSTISQESVENRRDYEIKFTESEKDRIIQAIRNIL